MNDWVATLSDGSIEQSDQAGAWRKLANRCKEKSLTIQSLKYDNEEIDERAVSYFVIHSAFSLMMNDHQSIRMGLGCFRPNGKCRIRWFYATGKRIHKNHSEIVNPIKAEAYKDLTIEVRRNSSEMSGSSRI